MKTLKSNISEAYKVQVDCLKDSESDSYDKNDMKEKEKLGCTRQCKKNWKQHHIHSRSKFLPLVSDKWSQMHCSEYSNVFQYLVWTLHEIKKVGGILAKPAPKKEKLSPLKHFIW